MQVGPYELLERLGAGGMAETHVAIRRGPGGFEQRVCLKRILPGMTEDPELVRLFHEEARVSARLGHANVAQVLDFGVAEDGGPYLVLELIEGSNLRALLREDPEPLTSGLVAYLATELGQALDYAHGERVVHRDLSPSNVLLSRAGEVKLGDFGIAKALSAERTRTGVVKGKVPYMAPEYAREGSFEPRSDLFALGVILYEALAGARPYDGANEPETIAKAARGERVPLAERVPEAPAALRDAIERLIEPELEARPESARAFLEALHDVHPPPTARRILAKRVRGLEAKAQATLPFEPTQPARPAGTLPLTGATAGPAPTPVVVPAGADEETRTRAPLEPETRTVRSGPPLMDGETKTRVDPAADPAVSRDELGPPLPVASRLPLWMALGALAAGGLAALAWWLTR